MFSFSLDLVQNILKPWIYTVLLVEDTYNSSDILLVVIIIFSCLAPNK
jgi:hypothetical protein